MATHLCVAKGKQAEFSGQTKGGQQGSKGKPDNTETENHNKNGGGGDEEIFRQSLFL